MANITTAQDPYVTEAQSTRCRRAWTIGLALCSVLLIASPAAAQQVPQPIGRFVVDVRASFPFYPHDAEIAGLVGAADIIELSSRGQGLTLGGHWYPFRWGPVTFGIGGEYFVSRGSRSPSEEELAAQTFVVPAIETRVRAFSPQISFNFGSRQGWSYFSGGIGNATLTVRPQGIAPGPDPGPAARTFNYGGGARWFNTQHVAFTLDMRIFAMNPIINDAGGLVLPRTTVIVLNVGIAFK